MDAGDTDSLQNLHDTGLVTGATDLLMHNPETTAAFISYGVGLAESAKAPTR